MRRSSVLHWWYWRLGSGAESFCMCWRRRYTMVTKRGLSERCCDEHQRYSELVCGMWSVQVRPGGYACVGVDLGRGCPLLLGRALCRGTKCSLVDPR